MSIDQDVYLEEMKKLLADAKRRLLAEWPCTEVYTVSVWTDPNAARSAVCFDTPDNSLQKVRQSNEWTKQHYDKYMADGNIKMAGLFQPREGRNQNPADFRFSRIATIKHQSIVAGGKSTLIAGGDKPIKSSIWPELNTLLRLVQEHARLLYHDLRLHPDAELPLTAREIGMITRYRWRHSDSFDFRRVDRDVSRGSAPYRARTTSERQ